MFTPLRLVSVVVAGLVVAGCQAETAPVDHPPRPVQVTSVAYEDAGKTRSFVGIVAPRTETDLAFRVGGKIVVRTVSVGDQVKAGAVVARLDPQDLALQVESAEAELSAATSNLAQASADLDRFETLKTSGYATVADFDRKAAAKAEAAARVERARRTLDLARHQAAYAELTADVDGVVTATPAEPGQVVAIGQPVVRLAHLGGKEAVIALPEDWFQHASGAPATVTLWSGNGRRYTARLRELSPQADPATRTYRARFTIDGADEAVAFGMTATVTLSEDAKGRVARLPLAAVMNHGTGPSVFVVADDGALALRPVTVAAFTEDAALLSAGVNDGEKVVTLGVQKLQPGQRVRTVLAN